MDDLSRFCCQNPDCPDHGKRGAGNLTVCRPLRQAQAHPAALLPHLQGPLLRAQGHAPVRLPAARGEGRLGPGAPRRGLRRPPDRPARRRATATPSSATAAWPAATPATLHDELVAFSPSDPRGPVRREVVVRRQEAGELRPATTRPMTTRGTGGTTSPSTPSTGWSSASCPGHADVENVEAVVDEVQAADRGAAAEADDQRRVPGLRDGDPGRPTAQTVTPRRPAGRAGRKAP